MGWEVRGESGSVTWSGSTWTADPVVEARIRVELADHTGVLATPTGPTYVPSGAGDELGVYLLARAVMPDARLVSGTPPHRTLPGAKIPEDAVS